MTNGGGMRGPSVSTPGSSVTVEVDGPGSVVVAVPGGTMTPLPVQDGHVTFPVPPGTPVGSQFHVILLGRLPPLGITITVVAK